MRRLIYDIHQRLMRSSFYKCVYYKIFGDEMDKQLLIALRLAKKYHRQQKRWNGEPYISHPISVAEMLMSDKHMVVALLHDVIEDSECSKCTLINAGIRKEFVEAVDVISHKQKEPYIDYILRVKQNELARIVKIADITHNLQDIERYHKKDKKDKYVLAKYILEN